MVMNFYYIWWLQKRRLLKSTANQLLVNFTRTFSTGRDAFCALVCQAKRGTSQEITWCWRKCPRNNHRLLSISSDRVPCPLLSFHLHQRGKVWCEGLKANQENALASHRAVWRCSHCMLGSLPDPSQIEGRVFLCLWSSLEGGDEIFWRVFEGPHVFSVEE